MDGIRPVFKITANDKNITATIKARLMSIRITDEIGMESDTLEITITDDHTVQIPPTGAELKIFIGYDGRLVDMGLYVVDEIERTGYPRQMTIRGKAAVQEKTPKGKKSLRSQQSREWENGTSLKAVVQKIAKEHGLTPVVSKDLESVVLPHTMQTDESNLNFILRIAKKYDAVVKPANGKLIVKKVGTGKSASGKDVKAVTIDEKGVKGYSLNVSKRENTGTVVSYYHDKATAKRHNVVVGDGSEPVKRIKSQYGTKDEAVAGAKSEFDKRERGQNKINIQIVGNPEIFAESKLITTGFVGGMNGTWIISRVEHEITPEGGFTTTIESAPPTTGDAEKKKKKKGHTVKDFDYDAPLDGVNFPT